jgi:hypothetical protein
MRYKLFEDFVANKEQALNEAMGKPVHKSGSAKTMKPMTDKMKPETAKPAKSASMKDMKTMADKSKAKAPAGKHSADVKPLKGSKATKLSTGSVSKGTTKMGSKSSFEAKMKTK